VPQQTQVIPGWEAGILGTPDLPPIRAGGTRTVLIPPELAYGPAGDGCLFGLPDSCRIPPNSPVVITFRYQGLGY
jgi:peptidylprolyl isomerase